MESLIYQTTESKYKSAIADRTGGIYLSPHRPFFLPSFQKVFYDSVGFLQQTIQDEAHLAKPVVFLDDGLMLVYDERNALKQRGQRSDVV